MLEKLRSAFDEMVVYKDLQKVFIFSSLKLPSFMRDWLIKNFADEEGHFEPDEINRFVHQYMPTPEEWQRIKSELVCDGKTVKLFAQIGINIDTKTSEVNFSLPKFHLKPSETVVDPYVWDKCKDELLTGTEVWGMIELGYRYPNGKSQKPNGKITLENFKNFCPYDVDLEYYKDARADFTPDEWIDVVLGAIDYNPAGSKGDGAWTSKMTMLSRILPFVEPRLNLVELAPKGTGKSYVYGQVSRYGWLADGGQITRAKLFYDIQREAEGLICWNDFVVIDEVQKFQFGNDGEMSSILKGYLENGVFRVGNHKGAAEAGLILSGNIAMTTMNEDGYGNMFRELPESFHESALVDRFHGFIKGWKIPRMTDDLKVCGWALNSEYFTSILHLLRRDTLSRGVVDELIELPRDSDTRDTMAIKRIATAYMKLLFPHVRKPDEITALEFDRYCFRPAKEMRRVIKYQLGLLDPAEFGGKEIPKLEIRDRLCKKVS